MSDMSEMKATIDRLGRAWEEFKSVNDRKGATDADQLGRIAAQLEGLEARMNRPRSGGDGGGGDHAWRERPEHKGFLAYLRRGRENMSADEVKVLTVGTDTTAGYLAVSEYSREIIKAVTELSPIRQVARVRPTSSKSIQIPKRTGQFAAVRVSETGTRDETTGLTYGLEEIHAPEMYARVDVSLAMLEDSEFDLEAELRTEFAEQFAVLEGNESVNGTGVGSLEGLLTNADVAETVSGSAAAITADGLLTLKHAVKSGYARNGRWAFNRTTLGSIRKLKDTSNQYIWQPGLSLGGGPTIDGDPYVEFPDMPSEAANAYPVLYGDFFRAYTVADRVTLAVLRDPFSKANEGKVLFHARRRVGGQVVLAESIRKMKCST